MTLYRDAIRRLLRTTEGYECQEAEGNFMLVFQCPMRAVQFCLQININPTDHQIVTGGQWGL